MRKPPLKWTVPVVLALGSGAMILLQSRIPAGPRYAPFAFLRPLAELRGENPDVARLKAENAELLASLLRQQSSVGELQEQLRKVSAYREAGMADISRVMPASVVLAEDASGWHGTVLIDKGTRDGVKPGQVVADGPAVVGRVMECGEATSRVRLITDPAFRMKASAVRAGRPGQVTGILAGQGDGTCRLEYVLDREEVGEGWQVMTVHDPDRGWSAGMLVGDVVKGGGSGGVYGEIIVQPRAGAGDLRHVLILIGK
ncbi:MAG: rod shape-determining protein MreC [Candidatus Brocadiae bacterium]|nr:rod shape-determining protein MreC [Candidatus Brocadiia bacterium]